MRRTKIAQVIVDTRTALALVFCSVRHTFHIAVVVVGPYDGDVVWHPQAGIVDVERFLVGHEYLRLFLGLGLLVFLEYLTLLLEYFLQRTGTVYWVGAALHGLVVQTAHTHCIDVVVLGSLTDAIVEFLQDGGAVGLVVPFTVARFSPFRWGGIVEEQRLTVARGNHDAPFGGYPLTLGMAVERSRTRVHRGG